MSDISERGPGPDSGAAPTLASVLTCPHCGHAWAETMPTDACLFFHECPGCGVWLRPKPGDCCVFCSFGSVPCPPVQASRAQAILGQAADSGAG